MTDQKTRAAPSETAAERVAPTAAGARGSRRHWVRQAVVLYALVALGSMIGGLLRAIASLAIHGYMDPGFPWGTMFVNVTGSFAIGFYATLSGPDGRLLAGSYQRQFIMTGIFGGYTTFSIFSLETFALAQAGALSASGVNLGVSVAGWLAAVWLGHTVATGFNRLKGF